MALLNTIDTEIKAAMLAKNDVRLRGLRAIKAALLLAKTEKGAAEELSEEAEIKQRKESAEIYLAQNRADLAKIEQEEVAVLEEFLPKQLSPEELEQAIRKIITEQGVTDLKGMGKVIAAANKDLAGKSDGRSISEMVKKLLG
jgi:uncharacterized protein YqeY